MDSSTPLPATPVAPAAPVDDRSPDLSKRTLIMLVALSCIISLLSTFAMVYQLTAAHPAPTMMPNSPQTSAQAGLTIGTPVPQRAETESGVATLNIGT